MRSKHLTKNVGRYPFANKRKSAVSNPSSSSAQTSHMRVTSDWKCSVRTFIPGNYSATHDYGRLHSFNIPLLAFDDPSEGNVPKR